MRYETAKAHRCSHSCGLKGQSRGGGGYGLDSSRVDGGCCGSSFVVVVTAVLVVAPLLLFVLVGICDTRAVVSVNKNGRHHRRHTSLHVLLEMTLIA